MAVVLGLCTVFGTLIPPIFQGDFAAKLLDTPSGRIVLLGLAVTMLGIVVVALAAGEPIKALSFEQGTGPLWVGLPILCLVMFGGLITNALWCFYLIARNG